MSTKISLRTFLLFVCCILPFIIQSQDSKISVQEYRCTNEYGHSQRLLLFGDHTFKYFQWEDKNSCFKDGTWREEGKYYFLTYNYTGQTEIKIDEVTEERIPGDSLHIKVSDSISGIPFFIIELYKNESVMQYGLTNINGEYTFYSETPDEIRIHYNMSNDDWEKYVVKDKLNNRFIFKFKSYNCYCKNANPVLIDKSKKKKLEGKTKGKEEVFKKINGNLYVYTNDGVCKTKDCLWKPFK